jgi:hypothetical protein
MEDDRGKFIVIVAGYPEPMEDEVRIGWMSVLADSIDKYFKGG